MLKICTSCLQKLPNTVKFFMPRKDRSTLRSWCRKCYSTKSRSWAISHPDKNKLNLSNWRSGNRNKVLMYYINNNPHCMCPGCDIYDKEFLSVDHVNGGGNNHRKNLKGKSLIKWLIDNNFPPGFQILCFNCNFSKGANAFCPVHQKEVKANAA